MNYISETIEFQLITVGLTHRTCRVRFGCLITNLMVFIISTLHAHPLVFGNWNKVNEIIFIYVFTYI